MWRRWSSKDAGVFWDGSTGASIPPRLPWAIRNVTSQHQGLIVHFYRVGKKNVNRFLNYDISVPNWATALKKIPNETLFNYRSNDMWFYGPRCHGTVTIKNNLNGNGPKKKLSKPWFHVIFLWKHFFLGFGKNRPIYKRQENYGQYKSFQGFSRL